MSHIETGNTKLSLPVLVQLAEVLGVRTDDLLFEKTQADYTTAMKDIIAELEYCTPQQVQFIKELIRTAHIAANKYLQ